MTIKTRKISIITSCKKQHGAVLVISLIMLFLVMTVGLQSIQTSTMQEKMTGNSINRQKAIQAAEAGVRFGMSQLDTAAFSWEGFVKNSAKGAAYDIRRAGAVNTGGGNKVTSDWLVSRSIINWPWADGNKRGEMPDYVDAANSMNLVAKPQFAIGMLDPIKRKGSEGFSCMPYKIIGAGRGSVVSSSALIEVQVIPKSSCHRSRVK